MDILQMIGDYFWAGFAVFVIVVFAIKKFKKR
jgi:hypothetical protein